MSFSGWNYRKQEDGPGNAGSENSLVLVDQVDRNTSNNKISSERLPEVHYAKTCIT